MMLKNRPVTRHYSGLQKITKIAKTGVAGITKDDVIENFDMRICPARMRSRVILMSASDGIGQATERHKLRSRHWRL